MNNVVLIGKVVRDPDLAFIASSGTAVCKFTLAIDKDLSRDKKEEFKSQNKNTADFINIVVFGKMAESCANYLAKGRTTAVNGRIQTNTYEKKDGSKGYSTDVLANKVEFIDWGDDSKKSFQSQDASKPQPHNQYQNKPKQKSFNDPDDPFGDDDVFELVDNDSEIPF